MVENQVVSNCIVCSLPSKGIIRGKDVCPKCFGILQKDNLFRHSNNLEIPNNLKIMRKCYTPLCKNRFERLIDYQDSVLINMFCSPDCEAKNKQNEIKYKLQYRYQKKVRSV